MTKNKFHGVIPALVTPMTADGEIDKQAFSALISACLQDGVHGFVPVGTTGESPTLSHSEHDDVIAMCISEVAGQVPILAGTGSNSTKEAVRLTQEAEKAGADAALVVTPYYNKPTQDGLYAHYKEIADNTSLPVIIYNIPGRCIIDMSPETMQRLYKDCTNIVGVKDATGDVHRATISRLDMGDEFCQLTGEDASFAGFLAQGGHGVISVAANVAPKLYTDLYKAWQAQDLKTFAEMRDRIFPLTQALFCESSPSPVKYALSQIGIGSEYLRLPLVPASSGARKQVDEALRHAGLMN